MYIYYIKYYDFIHSLMDIAYTMYTNSELISCFVSLKKDTVEGGATKGTTALVY
jgi:hypothetical protein